MDVFRRGLRPDTAREELPWKDQEEGKEEETLIDATLKILFATDSFIRR
jgi:hypothetical protein